MKNGEKGDEKKKKIEKSKRKTQTRERIKKRKEEKRRKKGYTKEVCKKEAREIFKRCKNQEWKNFSKREKTLSAHEKVLAQDNGGEKHFLFFFQKKGKVDQKNTFLTGKVYKK